MKGEGNSYTTLFRQYDPRIGKWLSVDPESAQLPWLSPYVSMSNNPIMRIDPLGNLDEPVYGSDGKYRGDTKKGFTGEVLIYDGDENFSDLSKDELISKGAKTFDELKSDPLILSGNAQAKIVEHIVNKNINDGLSLRTKLTIGYEPLRFYNNQLGDNRCFFTANTNKANPTYIQMGQGNMKSKSYGDGVYYETTVENIRNQVILHEYMGHVKKGYGSNEEWKAYYNQTIHQQFKSTTNNFKRFTTLNGYIDAYNSSTLGRKTLEEDNYFWWIYYDSGAYDESILLDEYSQNK